MSFKKYASKKVIAIVMAVMLSVGALYNQQHKINNLQKQLYIQQNMTDQRYNYSETQIDISSLDEKLNQQCDFKE